jgi:AcrR family transcriptional regulator
MQRRDRRVPRTSAARTRSTSQATDVRAAILDTTRALYARGGYDTVTMGAIAYELGIKAPSLYHHFASKDAIFQELQRQTLVMLEEYVRADFYDPWEALRQYYWRYYEFSKARPEHFSLLFADPSMPRYQWTSFAQDTLRALAATAHSRVRRCIAARLLPKRTNVMHVSNILWSAVHGVSTLRRITGPQNQAFDRLAGDALDTALEGLKHRGKPGAGRRAKGKPRSR